MSVPVSAALRVLVVDDEALARQVLREYLEGIAGVEVLGECANGFDAVKAIAERSPDLVFLDVQMPKLDGFEVLELAGRATPVVFVTAYDEFAVRAFEVHAVDYLLKPISPERVERGDRAGAGAPGPAGRARAGGGAARRGTACRRRSSGSSSATAPASTSSISTISTSSRRRTTTSASTPAGKEYLKEQPLAEVEELLDATRFVRIHRSFILNIERIARVEPLTRDSRIVILKDGRRLPISRTGYQRLTALM